MLKTPFRANSDSHSKMHFKLPMAPSYSSQERADLYIAGMNVTSQILHENIPEAQR